MDTDLALYAAKDAGRGIYYLFDETLLVAAQTRKQLEDDLRKALSNGEMYVVYQSIVSTKTARVVGYEALLRWEHPTRGLIGPDKFIPVAEECGLIEGIGEWVLRTATSDAAQWPNDIRVAVNVSPKQFSNPQFPNIVASALFSSSLRPDRLELEITEGVFLNSDAHSDSMFRSLKNVGVRLALDDFGTGYSSLGYLQTAPFDKIKIDKSFVRGAMTLSSKNALIIQAIVSLAESLGMETTAEGVEAQDEIAFIRKLGCSHIQGFVYGKPMPISSVAASLDQDDVSVQPTGFRVTREPRLKVFRYAKILIDAHASECKIRNISKNGVMLESTVLDCEFIGKDVLIEILEGQRWTGNVRWVQNGKSGIYFERSIQHILIE